jgi:hypothetical protein
MFRSNLFPLRTTVGSAIAITEVRVVGKSPEAEDLDPVIELRTQLDEIIEDPMYAQLLPSTIRVGSTDYHPISDVATMPKPVDLPFAPAPFVSLFALGHGTAPDDEIARRVWYEFELQLDQENNDPVGGICYGGYPFLPYYVTSGGENSANFGLPREFQLLWGSDSTDDFVDSQHMLTNEEPTSHSGTHLLCTGPICTQRLRLRISHLPRLAMGVSSNQIDERWGFAIPYLFVFKYCEGTRYRARVPGGVLCALQVPSGPADPYLPLPLHLSLHPSPAPADSVDLSSVCCDAIVRDTSTHQFVHLSAASLFGQRRPIAFGGSETFVLKVRNNEQVRLFIEQAEENNRSIAGLRFRYPGGASSLGKRFRVEVYEVDPPEGVSPISTDPDWKKSKYLLRLFDGETTIPATEPWKLCFVRGSLARYFLVVFTYLDHDSGVLAIEDLQITQSTRVIVAPRPSRTQTLKTMHFRVMGQELASDYARIGGGDFSLSIEHWVGGQRKDALFSATSLLDLLRLGSARLYSNHRTWGIETETALTEKGSYSVQDSLGRTDGWQRTEAGDDLPNPFPLPDPSSDSDPMMSLAQPDSRGFTTLGWQESRNHTENIAPGSDNFGPDAQELQDLLKPFGFPTLFSPPLALYAIHPDVGLQSGDDAWWAPWGKNAPTDAFKDRLNVTGVNHANIPPYYIYAWKQLQKMGQDFTAWLQDPNKNPSLFDDFVQDYLQWYFQMGPFFLVGGMSIGANIGGSVGVSGGLSCSASIGIPSFLQSSATGSSGSIALQASQTGYSYAQHVNAGFSSGRSRTDFQEGLMIRKVKRDPDYDVGERRLGAEVAWQGQPVDIVTGSIQLGAQLPATASNIYKTSDERIEVRFGGAIGASLAVDVWFEVIEELVKDDY